uniref:Protein-serine/threonine kinase n=1 Tax=Erythrolobus australicus TaxID=1077150 RepID=A0A7S1TKN8_9RHOD|mmetsp:Transcript_2413/g.6519  ORF Transcript_2413/g.6519 Transcript_2413/m.6519 type:complete len:443 (+) Transcript_2413:222-1550(+)
MRAESQGLRLILRGARLRAFSGSPSVLAASLTHTTRWSRRLATQTLYDVANARTVAAAAAAFSQHRTDMEQIQSVVRRYADRKPAPLPLQFLNEFGHLHSDSKRLLAASWLKDELPVRLSRRVLELELLPRALCNMPSILAVRETYRASLLDIVTFPSLDAGGGASATATKTNVAAFGALLESIYARHQHVAHDVARGMLELRAYNPAMKLESDAKLQRFLDNFFRSRIAIRLMIGHYLATRDAAAHPSRIGIVNRQCSPAALARRATAEAQELARRYYRQSVVPEVCVLGHIDARFPYVDEHVFFCLRETLKNAMRAVIEKHADDRLGASYIYTPIRVVIARGTEDVSVRVTDNGVGMSLRELPVALCFGYTTAPPPALHSREKSNIFDNHVQAAGSIAGMGYGLPLSRLTAQFLGGDMELMSMQGAGTDVTFHFPRLPTA